MEHFEKYLVNCLELVEKKFGKGSSNDWNTEDFKNLSESVQKETGTLLSVSTLKRLWGRVNYTSRPHVSTLNVLAKYVGYEGWRYFLNLGLEDISSPEVISEGKDTKRYAAILVSGLLLIGLGFFFFSKKAKTYKPEDFSFKSRSIGQGIPNSVVFEYDASAAADDATIEIQQDWDNQKRAKVNREDSVATSIYYRPGYFKAKLVVDKNVVQENDVFIPTQGWLGLIEKDSSPIYLKKSNFLTEDRLTVTPEILMDYKIDPNVDKVVVGFYQVKDFGEVYTDDFEMLTVVKNEFKGGISACQGVRITVLYDGGAINMVLGDKGCSSKFLLRAFGRMVDGKKTDLSAFGVDFEDFAKVRCLSKNDKLDIFINEVLAYSLDVPISKKIVGMVYYFEGAGTIKNLEIKKNDKLYYTSTFE